MNKALQDLDMETSQKSFRALMDEIALDTRNPANQNLIRQLAAESVYETLRKDYLKYMNAETFEEFTNLIMRQLAESLGQV